MSGAVPNREIPRVCIATGTRADWGLLSPLARHLRDSGRVEVQILATNMHLSERYGHTVDEIIADGFDVAARVEMGDDGDDSPVARATAMAMCLDGTARALERLQPAAVVILGDRYEMLAVASAAVMLRIPIVHIAGGEVTEGAIDDKIRHAITKLASLHLTATEAYRHRVIQMGEQPASVVNIGAPGVWNTLNRPLPAAAEVLESLGIEGTPRLLLVTYHPVTMADDDPATAFGQLLAALDRFDTHHIIITYPNNDPRSHGIIDLIGRYAAARPGRVTAVPSLGVGRYLAATRMADAVVGNSSSGIVEVPSSGTPTVDIGPRQQGRLAGPSVIHCAEDADAIADAIARALSPEMQAVAGRRENPYARPDTIPLAAATIIDFVEHSPDASKHFYDIT